MKLSKGRLKQWDAVNRDDLKLLTETICEQVSVSSDSDCKTSPLKVIVDSLSDRQLGIFLAVLLENPYRQNLATILKNIKTTRISWHEIVEFVETRLPLTERHYVAVIGKPELGKDDFLSVLPKDLIHYIAKMLPIEDRRQLLFANRKMFHILGGPDSAPLWMQYGSICAVRNMYLVSSWLKRKAVNPDFPIEKEFHKNVKHFQQELLLPT